MQITVNGKDTEAGGGTTVEALLSQRGLARPGIAVAVNGVVVTAACWPDVALSAGDRVEIVTARQGG